MVSSTDVSRLLLNEDLANVLVGALLAVCRADGDANQEEMRALRQVSDELTQGLRVDHEWLLFFSNVTPRSLAEAVARAGTGPFRHQAVSSAAVIAHELVRAAVRVGRADGELNESEQHLIVAFGEALGLGARALVEIDASLAMLA
jgi:tellurite resistance protein